MLRAAYTVVILNRDLQASLIEKRGILFGTWCEYNEELGNRHAATELREQAIELYRQCCDLLLSGEEQTPYRVIFLKKRLAYSLNDLGYHLNRIGKYEEALEAVQQSIELKEQGYLQYGGLAASYGEKSQIYSYSVVFRKHWILMKRLLSGYNDLQMPKIAYHERKCGYIVLIEDGSISFWEKSTRQNI